MSRETDHYQKLMVAKVILENKLNYRLYSIESFVEENKLKLVFQNFNTLYITYNRVGEYAYQYMFSNDGLDRVRFDNYDKKWEVTTKPNHFHPRNNPDGFSSPMIGSPENDIGMLVELIINRELEDESKRF